MNGYFKPLRRKIGVVTLVMAYVFMVGWSERYSLVDEWNFGWFYFRLIKGVIWIWVIKDRVNVLYATRVPLWCITIPMFLFSAWLLLSRPRVKKPIHSTGEGQSLYFNPQPPSWDEYGKFLLLWFAATVVFVYFVF